MYNLRKRIDIYQKRELVNSNSSSVPKSSDIIKNNNFEKNKLIKHNLKNI